MCEEAFRYQHKQFSKKTFNILKAKSNFTQLIYIYLFLVLVSGILNVIDSYRGSINYSYYI